MSENISNEKGTVKVEPVPPHELFGAPAVARLAKYLMQDAERPAAIRLVLTFFLCLCWFRCAGSRTSTTA
jgi:hypothetical protein